MQKHLSVEENKAVLNFVKLKNKYYGTDDPKQCKTTIYKVCFKLILMYDTKMWTLKKREKKIEHWI